MPLNIYAIIINIFICNYLSIFLYIWSITGDFLFLIFMIWLIIFLESNNLLELGLGLWFKLGILGWSCCAKMFALTLSLLAQVESERTGKWCLRMFLTGFHIELANRSRFEMKSLRLFQVNENVSIWRMVTFLLKLYEERNLNSSKADSHAQHRHFSSLHQVQS